MAKAENEKAVMQEEPPYKRRSPLWRHQKEVRQLIEAGYSYRQILGRLGLTVSVSRLAAFARDELGITSRTRGQQAEGQGGQRPEEKRAGQVGEGAKRSSELGDQGQPPKSAPMSISEAFEDEADPLADLLKFRKS